MSAINGDVEDGKNDSLGKPVGQQNRYELLNAANETVREAPPEITWVDLNFQAGKKDILTNCWGKVRNIAVLVVKSYLPKIGEIR